MAEIVYPAALPTPQAMGVTPAERRALSQPERPLQARPIERDRRRFERVTFPPMDAAQMEAFRAWWREDLVLGGAWFSATWPTPEGRVAAVRKFIGVPARTFIPGGRWRMTAFTEVRGRSLTPAAADTLLFRDEFDGSGSVIGHVPDFTSAPGAYVFQFNTALLDGALTSTAGAAPYANAIWENTASVPFAANRKWVCTGRMNTGTDNVYVLVTRVGGTNDGFIMTAGADLIPLGVTGGSTQSGVVASSTEYDFTITASETDLRFQLGTCDVTFARSGLFGTADDYPWRLYLIVGFAGSKLLRLELNQTP